MGWIVGMSWGRAGRSTCTFKVCVTAYRSLHALQRSAWVEGAGFCIHDKPLPSGGGLSRDALVTMLCDYSNSFAL